MPTQGQVFAVPNSTQQIAIIQQGANVVVDGVDEFGSIDVDADNIVMWTEGPLNPEGDSLQPKDKPLEIYMEGNVVFRQGERIVYAQRMYYDARRQTGIVLAAEILTPLPQQGTTSYQGLVKLRAEVIQQVGPDRFLAQNASVTSSRFGVPGYELRSSLMTYDDLQHPRINPATGAPEVDSTGAPVIDHQQMVTSRNNVVYVEQVPVFYWPFMATDLQQRNFYVSSIQYSSDRIFGQRIMTDLDAYQVFGIKNRLPNTRLDFERRLFQLRGPAGGTTFTYKQQDLFGVPQSASGFVRRVGHRRSRARQPGSRPPRFDSAAAVPRPHLGSASPGAAR